MRAAFVSAQTRGTKPSFAPQALSKSVELIFFYLQLQSRLLLADNKEKLRKRE